MNTKCLIKDPFTKGDYFHTTNPFYYGTKRPVIPKKNLNKPFDHSPFQPLISGVGFGNLPKVAVNSRPADARFQTDSRGWFPINQPKNRPFCFSPFELQISGVKTDQSAPFYQAGETMLSTDTIQKAIALGTEIRSAETSRKAQEAATFIPTIFQKIGKYTNDKLSNPALTMADYLNAAELQYLKSLNVKSLEELKTLMGTMNANMGALAAAIPPPAIADAPAVPAIADAPAVPDEAAPEAGAEEEIPDLEPDVPVGLPPLVVPEGPLERPPIYPVLNKTMRGDLNTTIKDMAKFIHKYRAKSLKAIEMTDRAISRGKNPPDALMRESSIKQYLTDGKSFAWDARNNFYREVE